ncbi:MAG: hypothetical protein HY611_08865 [Elusimicrobia bacterium]|nr:hypothetical protein [Elusimicrobiota bacterium]
MKSQTRPGSDKAQATVEYLLVTVAFLILFTSIYGFLQDVLKSVFMKAGFLILKAYY